MNEKISVIIPIYKVEEYLDRCITSVVNQTYSNLEIILVDDGSPDNCPKICDEWAKKDERIKVIHKKNGGISDARNAGMKISSGEWINFIDSDDWIHKRYFEILINNSQNADLIVVDSCSVNSYVEDCDLSKISVRELNLEEGFKNQTIKNLVWGRLYKKEVIGDIIFPQKFDIGEDSMFNMKIFDNNDKLNIRQIEEKLYYYFIRPDSIMRTYQPDAWLKICEYCLNNIESAKKKDLYLCEAFKTLFLYRYEEEIFKKNKNNQYKLYIKRCFKLLKKEKRITKVKKMYYYVAGISLNMYRLKCIASDRTIINWEKIQKEKYKNMN